MTWTEIFSATSEVIKTIGSIVTAGAAVTGAYVAWRGLQKWKDETVGKRRAELAEEVLAGFYEARDIILSARTPASYQGEGNTRVRQPGETEQEAGYLNAIYSVIERLGKQSDFFARLHATRYRFNAYFGSSATKPYADLRKVQFDISIAVQFLINAHRRPHGWDVDRKKTTEWETTMGWGIDEEVENSVPKRLDEIVKAIEDICRPAIQASARKSQE